MPLLPDSAGAGAPDAGFEAAVEFLCYYFGGDGAEERGIDELQARYALTECLKLLCPNSAVAPDLDKSHS
jgi:hypothetical protein